MEGSVCAVVVTHNRRALLEECLRALQAQLHRIDAILVIDNASTDGTAEMFKDGGYSGDSRVRHVPLPGNFGGAGGFRRGLELGKEIGTDWFWLMDDDTIPSATALGELFAAYDRFPREEKPVLPASKVVWTDGSIHSMNLPTAKRPQVDPEGVLLATERATLSLRWASFVSVLINRLAIEQHGLPHADYFIWNDDTEYTARILRAGSGVLVPQSVVTHKTVRKHNPMDASPERAYYQVRNVLWMILRSAAWRPDEKLKIGLIHLHWICTYLRRGRFRWPHLRSVARGLRDGLTKIPAP